MVMGVCREGRSVETYRENSYRKVTQNKAKKDRLIPIHARDRLFESTGFCSNTEWA